jgi:hypothetical protein
MTTLKGDGLATLHDYKGRCPDKVNGPDARDSRCPACVALVVLAKKAALAGRMAEALRAMQMEAQLRECGLRITDEVLTEWNAITPLAGEVGRPA